MSYIEGINQAATAATQNKKDRNETGNILGKEDFLTLLVAQLQNQDPLNPDDPTEFTAQLAQFSSLEQLFNLNDSMNGVATAVSDSQKLSALSLIGKEVTYADSDFSFGGTPVQVGYSLDGPAEQVRLQLQLDGATVATLDGNELNAGDHFLNWNGLTDEGAPAPVGDYTIVIQATAAEGAGSIAAAPLVRSEVTGIDLNAGNGGLLYTRGGEVSLLEIKGVYETGSGIDQETAEEEKPEETEKMGNSGASAKPVNEAAAQLAENGAINDNVFKQQKEGESTGTNNDKDGNSGTS